MNIIFSDVDGTIYTTTDKGQSPINPQTLKDIKKSQDKGIEFVICTGNGYFENMAQLAQKLNVRYVITSSGSSIFDRTQNDFIFKSMITTTNANKILQYAMKHQIAAIWWDEQDLYINKFVSKSTIAIIKSVMQNTKKLIVAKETQKPVFKIEIYDERKKVAQMKEIEKDVNLQFAYISPWHIEINHIGVSKGLGITKLCELLKVDLKNTMGIGDSANDLGMFKVVSHSYAMDNANDDIKKAVDHYTADVRQNGLGMAIIDYMYREKLDK